MSWARLMWGLIVLASSFGIIRVSGSPPEFIYPLDNVTVLAGREAQFTCHVNNLEGYKVAWLRSDGKAILAIHNHMVTNNKRMTVSHNGLKIWKLHIKDVQKNDSGSYMCMINSAPMVSTIGMLEVVEAPDIIYSETSNDTSIMEGESVTLRCEARGYPEPTLTWQREDRRPIVLRNNSGGYMLVKDGIEGRLLRLTKVTRADGGTYLCIAQNGIPSPVSKRIVVHVNFPPTLRARQQLVSSAPGTQATMECIVQASPRSANYWVKLNQGQGSHERIINLGGRIRVVDIDENISTQRMVLTIENVQSGDFGTYACITRNSLGDVRRTVQLQGNSTLYTGIGVIIQPLKMHSNTSHRKLSPTITTIYQEKFEEIENKFLSYTDTMPTERVSSEYMNTWRSSRASSTYPHISFNLFITIIMSLLISILRSATSLID